MTDRLDRALSELHKFDALASRDRWMNRKHPLVKLIVTILYILLLVSFPKYDLAGLAAMAVYPAAGFILAELSLAQALRRLRYCLPLLLVLGIFNPVFDRTPMQLGLLSVSGGSISMCTLLLKGVFSLLAAYLLMASTSIEDLCAALRSLHLPEMLVTTMLLMYRYIFLFLGEASRISAAYALRAPGQKGVGIRAWGPLLGQFLLRSIDRAQLVYESMLLRGYDGSPSFASGRRPVQAADLLYLLFWGLVLTVLRIFPVILLAGRLAARLLPG